MSGLKNIAEEASVPTIEIAPDVLGLPEPPPPSNSIIIETEQKDLIVLVMLGIFSFAGTAARLGLQRLYSFDGTPVFQVIYPEMAGSFVMGYVFRHKGRIEAKFVLQLLFCLLFFISVSYYPLYIGFTTGFCGCLTTFSSLVLQATTQAFNLYSFDRSIFQSVRIIFL